MIDLQEKYEWRWEDPSNGLLFPYYTKPFLDELATWKLDDKSVLEIGGGSSTVWWNDKAKYVATIEYNVDYVKAILPYVKSGNKIIHPPWVKTDDLKIKYSFLPNYGFDIAIVDCEVQYRDDYVPKVLPLVRTGGLLILDNWIQASCWMPKQETIELISKYKTKRFKQPDHYDWSTLLVYL